MRKHQEYTSMSDKAEFFIVYDGPALQSHEMDVRELAPALLGIGNALEQANLILNGEKTKVSVNVKGSFKTGSFGIEFTVIQGCISHILDFFNSQPVTGTLNLLTAIGFIGTVGGGLIGLLKWLRSRQITNVKRLENGKVQVFVSDEYMEVTQEVVELLRDFKLRQSLEEAITKPLQKEGIDTFAVRLDDNTFLTVEKDEREWFTCPLPQGEEIEEKIEIEKLQVVSISFREDNKWRFTDGTTTFHATVLDEKFLNRIANNEEHFAKDDIYEVKIRKKRWTTAEGVMKSEYEVLEIISHFSAAKQLKLPFENH